VLADLGGRPHPGLTGEYTVSFENLGRIDADLIVLRTYGDEADLKANPLWRRLGAVRSGRVHEVDGAATNVGSALGAHYCLAELDRAYALVAG
jgi:iron complex transport system substrate-binding protein